MTTRAQTVTHGMPVSRSQELARGVIRIAVPAHGHDLGRVDHGPPGIALKADQAVGANLHAGQLVALGRGEPHLADSADQHHHRPRLTNAGLEQVANRLTGHGSSPPGTAKNRMPIRRR